MLETSLVCRKKKCGWDMSGAVLQGGDDGRQRRAWSGSGCAARASPSGEGSGEVGQAAAARPWRSERRARRCPRGLQRQRHVATW